MKERQKKILKSVIREYQKTGQPVSSQVLTDKYRFNFSPATIRAEMLFLDDEGFLEQPYTSAGRVPTDKALRLFINECDNRDLSASEKDIVWERIERFHQDSIKEVAQFLADCSHGLGISGFFGREVDFHGVGLRWLAEEPEFEGADLKNIMRSFDSLEDDFNKFFADMEEETEIFIGRENPIKYLRNYSLVITGFENEEGRGVLGILGPKRMNYQKNKFVVEETRKKIKK
jgi:heat-inducible transcriptional repressor